MAGHSALLPTTTELAGAQALEYMGAGQGHEERPELGGFGPGGFGTFAPLAASDEGPSIVPWGAFAPPPRPA